MDPVVAAALAQYLAEHCSGSISLQCSPRGANGGPARAQCPSAPALAPPAAPWAEGCATACPEPDYSDPAQPYFWDHTTMCT